MFPPLARRELSTAPSAVQHSPLPWSEATDHGCWRRIREVPHSNLRTCGLEFQLMPRSERQPEYCYACKERASTKEHAPPLCFFPEGRRNNLITVPSCQIHDNSKDVEYVKNVVVSAASLGPESRSVFAKTLRSVERSPALLATTYPILYALEFKGVETGAIEVDLKRFGRVMTAITQAPHFRDFRVKVRVSRSHSRIVPSADGIVPQ